MTLDLDFIKKAHSVEIKLLFKLRFEYKKMQKMYQSETDDQLKLKKLVFRRVIY